jgi:hypothetical protein
MKKTILVIVGVFILIQLAAVDLQAIPAFARKYQMTCKTCHTPFPKLKPYGDEFAANGYVIKDKDAPRYNIDTGDDFLSLIRDLPLAVRLDGFVTYNNSATRQLDFASPFMMKFLSGGEITKNVSYFFYFIFSEMGEIAGIEDAFLMFNNLFGSGFDFYVGQFQVSDPIFKRELRLTLEDYQIFSTEVSPWKSSMARGSVRPIYSGTWTRTNTRTSSCACPKISAGISGSGDSPIWGKRRKKISATHSGCWGQTRPSPPNRSSSTCSTSTAETATPISPSRPSSLRKTSRPGEGSRS